MQHFLGRRPVLTLLRKEKVAAEPTDELHFLKALALVARFLSSNARFKGVNLAPEGEGGAEGDERGLFSLPPSRLYALHFRSN